MRCGPYTNISDVIDGGEVIFKNYRVGFIEDLLED